MDRVIVVPAAKKATSKTIQKATYVTKTTFTEHH